MVTGLQLKLERVAARIKQWDIAEKVGISQSQLSLIENERREVSDELVKQILGAIEELRQENGNPISR